MSNEQDVLIYRHYCPPGVKRVLACGGSAFIGEVDESTILKYPLEPDGEMTRLGVEKEMLETIGPHPRIIGLQGFSDAGIYLERAINGTLADYILNPDISPPSVQQRLSWCREAAEAVAHIHSKRVLHCDIQPTNLLLDKKLHVKLADFQGRVLSEDGDEVLLDGWSGEPCRFSCPRDDTCHADYKTDLFALGCTIYFIMMGYAVFPDIVDGEDGWYDKVEERFAKQQFPEDDHACSFITSKCWRLHYNYAKEIVQDIESVEKKLAAGS